METGQLSYEKAFRKSEKTVNRLSLIDVQGVPLKSVIAKNLDSILQFCPDPSDLLIATYPKAGKIHIIHIIKFRLNDEKFENI